MILKNKERSGFTIVELLVVVVVIAILAAITVVSYNGITKRAKISLVVSNLTNASMQLKTEQVLSSTELYVNTQAEANGGRGLPASEGMTYQYTANNTVNPSTFCITASMSGIEDYMITESTVPAIGLCPGHVASIPSQSITNLSTNPSVETDTTGFTGGTRGTSVRTTAAAKEGSYGMQFTVNQVGYFPRIYLPVLLVSPSTVYTISVWVKSDAQVRIAYAVNSGTIISGNLTDSNSQWVRLSITTSSTPTNATNIATSVGFADNSPLNSTFDVDGIMITQGSTNFKYSDGSTTGWTWSGTVNKSSSSGMSL